MCYAWCLSPVPAKEFFTVRSSGGGGPLETATSVSVAVLFLLPPNANFLIWVSKAIPVFLLLELSCLASGGKPIEWLMQFPPWLLALASLSDALWLVESVSQKKSFLLQFAFHGCFITATEKQTRKQGKGYLSMLLFILLGLCNNDLSLLRRIKVDQRYFQNCIWEPERSRGCPWLF